MELQEGDVQLIIDAFHTPDELGKILRVHLAIEIQVNFVIKKLSPNINLSKGMTFYTKCMLLRAMRFPDGLVELIETFNKLRNQFAHNHKAKLGDNKNLVDKILELGKQGYDIMNDATYTFNEEKTGKTKIYKYVDMSNVERVVFIGIWASIMLGTTPKRKRFLDPEIIESFPHSNW